MRPQPLQPFGVRRPPAITGLRAVTVPAQGGETVFSDQYAAFDSLDPALVQELDGASVTHFATEVTLEAGDEQESRHPLFRRHPLSRRTALYLSTPSRLRDIDGVDSERSRELIRTLCAHSTRPENLVAHRWAPGDVVIWDNLAVMHRADHSATDGDRVLHRGLVIDGAPERPGPSAPRRRRH